jgi:septal ring factor EnvC (AmiA/AmiB activator)
VRLARTGQRPQITHPERLAAMSSSRLTPWILRALMALSVCAVTLCCALAQSGSADVSSQLDAAKSAASQLRAQIAADSAQIAKTDDGLQAAQAHLDAIQTDLDRRVNRLKSVQNQLLAARDHLVDVENHLKVATKALAANLVAGYESQPPTLVSVVLSARGFNQLLNQFSFAEKVAKQNANVVQATRVARREVAAQAKRLQTLEQRDRALAQQVLRERNQAAALRSALKQQQIREIAARAKVHGRYATVEAQVSRLQRKLNAEEAAAARAANEAAATGNASVNGITLDTNGMVQPPADAPDSVKRMIAAGNAIATLPYIYGGGHASFQANGYDCSGSVSYVLAAAGLVSSPMVSGQFDDWGVRGPGRWVTIYSNADHVWMTIAGWRFDTVAQAETGTRWARGGGEFAGFYVEHPAGL